MSIPETPRVGTTPADDSLHAVSNSDDAASDPPPPRQTGGPSKPKTPTKGTLSTMADASELPADGLELAPPAKGSLTLPAPSTRISATDPWARREARPLLQRELRLTNPYTDATAHSAVYAALPAAMGWALEKLGERYPDVDRHWAARFLELAVVVGAEVPWMVYSHEAGHVRAGRANGWEAQIEMTGWMSGMTWYSFPPGTRLSREQDMLASAAGVNQEQLNSLYVLRDWAVGGGARYQEALGFLLAQTNLALYAGRSVTRGDGAPSWDDLDSYVRNLNAGGNDLKKSELFALAAAADLLSAPFWAALVGGVRFVATGDRRVEVPRVNLGPVAVTLPNLHVLLTTRGPLVGGTSFVNGSATPTLELRADVLYGGEAGAVTARLHGIPLGDPRLRLTPMLRGTFDQRQGPGVALGADVQVEVHPNVGLTAGASYRSGDLLNEAEGRQDGVEGHLGVVLRF